MDVKRGSILFRCDGTRAHGWETFYQCLSFAAALQRRRRGTHFFSYLDPLSLAQVAHRANNEWTPAEAPMGEPGDIEATVREIRRVGAAAVVLSGPAVTPQYVERVAATGATVLAFDPAATPRLGAKVVVNPFLAPGRKAFSPGPDTQLLLGRKFALVRGVFRRQRTIRATEQPGPFRALVAFGDDDAADQTLLRTRQLLDTPNVDKCEHRLPDAPPAARRDSGVGRREQGPGGRGHGGERPHDPARPGPLRPSRVGTPGPSSCAASASRN